MRGVAGRVGRFAGVERERRRNARWQRLAAGSVVQVDGFSVRVNDGLNLANSYDDIFRRRIYAFHPTTPSPAIIDGGANIGLSVLFFKKEHPQARIRAFEPDPRTFPYLEENVARNGLDGVTLERAAIGAAAGSALLHGDGMYTSYLDGYVANPHVAQPREDVEIPVLPLADLLAEPVDFMKLNIEGAETDVVVAAGDALRAIRELAIEYHHLPGLPRTLHTLLGQLDENGFEYVVNSFGDSNPGAQPPFELGPSSSYYLLVYGRRRD
jgi:FkbM family methyltransferase